ncbi:MAG: ROK family protein [Cyclobacteriaceae bacterium]|nr:ROK family protein [Cyclobacteriaceae bacterium]
MKQQHLWGIDLGGTKIEGAVIHASHTGTVLFRDRIPTEASQGYTHVVNQIARLVDAMEKHMGYHPEAIGIGTPGTLDPQSGLLKNSNSVVLNGKPLKDDLQEALGVQIVMANDANCFALAETRMGVVAGRFPQARVVFGVIMGTGVGGGIVVEGKAIQGLQGIAGEWGHNFLDESGGLCYCGKYGCVEKVIAGPALEKFYELRSGTHRSLREIQQLALENKDPHAVETLNRLTHFFGKALSVVVNILDPDVIVVGGGVGNIDALYNQGVESLRRYVFNNRLETPVVKPLLGDSAGVFGAALLTA